MAHTRLESRPPESRKPSGALGVQPLFHAGNQFFPDLPAEGVQIAFDVVGNSGEIGIAYELPVGVVVAGGKGKDFPAKPHEVFGLAGKDNGAVFIVAIEEGADADGIPAATSESRRLS